MPNTFLVQLFAFKQWANCNFYGALLAQSLPSDSSAVITALFTLDHAMRVDRLFRARLEGTSEPYETIVSRSLPNLQDLADQVAQTDAWYVGYVTALTEAELSELVEFKFVSDEDMGRLARADILAHVLTHTQSHRAAVAKMLEPLKLRLPSDMFTSFVSGR